MAFFFLLSLIFLLLAVVTGEACYAIFDQRGSSLTPLINQYLPGFPINISAAMDALDLCFDGKSLITVLTKTKLLGNDTTSAFDLDGTFNRVLNKESINATFQSIDVS